MRASTLDPHGKIPSWPGTPSLNPFDGLGSISKGAERKGSGRPSTPGLLSGDYLVDSSDSPRLELVAVSERSHFCLSRLLDVFAVATGDPLSHEGVYDCPKCRDLHFDIRWLRWAWHRHVFSSLKGVTTSEGRLRTPGVQMSRQCQSVQSITGSTLQPHQRLGDGAEQGRDLVAPGRSAEPVQAVRDPDQCCLLVSRGQYAQHLHDDHRQGFRQPVGRQHGRRTRQARGRA